MAAPLPLLTLEQFTDRLVTATPVPISDPLAETLHLHYQELRRWNPSLSLVGPGATQDAVERHYAESLAGAPLIPDGARNLIDVGSGAGFPGFVLAALRRDLEVTLVEPRERRWAFLESAARRASLPCHCLNARVGSPLPAGIPEQVDVVTVRALKLDPEALTALLRRFAPTSRLLVWAGAEPPATDGRLEPVREVALPGSERRRILELAPPVRGARSD